MKNKIFPFVAFRESIDDHKLFSLMYFLQFLNDSEAEILSNVPMNELLLQGYDQGCLVLAIGIYELHQGINIPDEFLNFSLTPKQFIAETSKLPIIAPKEFAEHLREIVGAAQKAIQDEDRKKWN